MAKRESKGQQVKTFKHWIPQPDATNQAVIGKVYLEAENGNFVIYLADHIASVMAGLDIYERNSDANRQAWLTTHRGQVRSTTLNGALALYEATNRDYEESIKNLCGKKVIEVSLSKNLPWREDRPHAFSGGSVAVGGGFGDSISFAQSPALSMNYRVLWRVNNKLYKKIHHEAWGDRAAYDTMSYAGSVNPKSTKLAVIDWTQEREDFLAGIVSKITELGWLLSDFLGDAETNITHALTAGGGMLSLAPPPEAALSQAPEGRDV